MHKKGLVIWVLLEASPVPQYVACSTLEQRRDLADELGRDVAFSRAIDQSGFGSLGFSDRMVVFAIVPSYDC